VAAGAGAVAQQCWALEPPEAKAVTERERSAEKSSQKPNRQPHLDLYGDPLPEGAVARLGSLCLYHGAVDLRRVVLSPDGKLVASTDTVGFNKLWDVQTGRELPLPEHLRLAFLFGGKGQLLGVGQDNRLWNVATDKEVPADLIRKNMRLFAEQVMRQLRKEPADKV
jgi:hypothetical protein